MQKRTTAVEAVGGSLSLSAANAVRTVGALLKQPAAGKTRPGATPSNAPAHSRAAHPMKVVLVTMDSHLASAAQRAARTLARQLPGLNFSVHAADEWGSDEHALERCKADIATGDIVIVTMLFLEDHFIPLLPIPAAA